MQDYPSGPRERSAKSLFVGSNPTSCLYFYKGIFYDYKKRTKKTSKKRIKFWRKKIVDSQYKIQYDKGE